MSLATFQSTQVLGVRPSACPEDIEKKHDTCSYGTQDFVVVLSSSMPYAPYGETELVLHRRRVLLCISEAERVFFSTSSEHTDGRTPRSCVGLSTPEDGA